MPVQDNEIKQKKSEPAADLDEKKRQQIANQQEKNSVQKSGKLLPFLNAKAKSHSDRIDSLNHKIATKQDKLRKNEAKIDWLSEKADKLEDTNKMLKAMLGKVPLVQKMIESNEKKIQDIRENKIPKRQEKCSQHKQQIEKLTHKRDIVQHKLDRVVSLSNVITSFAIGTNQERRKAFAKAMDSLNTATFNCVNDKRENLSAKKNQLMEKYENTYSIAERMNLQDKISALTAKIDTLDVKLKNCQKDSNRFEKAVPLPEFSDIQFGKHDFDAVMVGTMDEISSKAEKGNFSIPKIAENAVITAINTQEMSLEDMELFKTYIPENYLENAEMLLEDDYNMIDGIINNGSKEDLEKLKTDIQNEIEASEDFINHPHVSDFIKDSIKEDLPKLKENLARVESALETMSEVKSKPEQVQTTEEPVMSIIDTGDWLPKLIDEDKAIVGEDGSFKIDPDYYKELPKKQRHIESMTTEQASAVMGELVKQNIRFSGVSRDEDKVSLTIDRKDIPALNQIKKDTLGIVTENKPRSQSEHYQTVNPEYYQSLPKEQRFTRVEPKDVAREIVKGLLQAKIPYSAVVRKNDTVALTVSKENRQAYQNIENSVKGERAVQFVNPDFFKSLPKEERFTQGMNQEQAQEKIQELSEKGIPHSAVLNGEKSAVTVAKRDSQTAFFSRKKLQQEAQRISGQRSSNPPEKSQNRKKPGLE